MPHLDSLLVELDDGIGHEAVLVLAQNVERGCVGLVYADGGGEAELRRDRAREVLVLRHAHLALPTLIVELPGLGAGVHEVAGVRLVVGHHFVLLGPAQLDELDEHVQVVQEVDHVARLVAKLEGLRRHKYKRAIFRDCQK